MKLRVFTTLRQRVALLLVSVLVPAVVLVIMNALATRTRDAAAVQQEAVRLARLAGAAHERLAETTDQLFAALAQAPSLTGNDPDACRMSLRAVVRSGPRFQNMGVLSRDGTLLCSAVAVAAPPAADRPWLREALQTDRLVVSRYEPGGLGAQPTVILARRIAAGDDRVVFAALNLAWLAELTGTLPPDASVTIVDDAGAVIARRAAGDGTDRLYGTHRVPMSPGSGFTVTVGIPVAAAYQAADARLRTSLAVLAVVALVTVLVARKVSDRFFTSKIEALLRAARRLSAGDLSARTDEKWSDDELGELARTFDSMAWAVGQRTEDLRQMMESLRALAARLQSVREEERTRISREIHDELGQTLTGIRMDLDRLDERIAAAPLNDQDRQALDSKIVSVRRLVDSGLETSRRISRQLRPSVLDVLGLKAGIEWQLDEFRARTSIDTDLLAPDDLGDIGEQVAITLFRILQEALTNVMRHADATMVTVRIDREGDAMAMEVMDNGRGFDQGDRPYPISLGLLGMRERAAVLGGLTTITSRPGHGTTVHVSLPVGAAPGVPGASS